ncbi:MAG TPA: type III-B CRISPR-associated protein Cas10/Cmr2 [Leptolyngbyaceae cyanobacterium]
MTDSLNNITTAICWCLAWGDTREPKFAEFNLTPQQMLAALQTGEGLPQEIQDLVTQVKELQEEEFPDTLEKLKNLPNKYPQYWNAEIGLVYGGATKIKQYVFEAAKLPDIRGASALLDRINLVDLPAFFHCETSDEYPQCQEAKEYCEQVRAEWLDKSENFPGLSQALIPELIIYSTGGNILAFCPAAFIDDLANAVEKRYTEETLTANSCAVGEKFKLLEIKCGLLNANIAETFWLENYQQEYQNPLVEAYFGKINDLSKIRYIFIQHKSFNELTTKLAIRFNQRRSGNESKNRPSRRYPPMFETHPYLKRDDSEKRSAIAQINQLPGKPNFSETLARKRRMGDRAKTGISDTPKWYLDIGLEWEPRINESWIDKFERFLIKNPEQSQRYYGNINTQEKEIKISQSLTHLGKVSNGYIAYIYADGNNMGGFIQNIPTPKEYQEFSQDVDNATKYAVYQALAYNLHPREIRGISEPESKIQNGDLIHPFEIITIGGDDILLIVPADKALQIAQMIGEQFEKILLRKVQISDVQIKDKYEVTAKKADLNKFHRFCTEVSEYDQCQLSISSGVLITSYNTPVYYAEKLTNQLMKSAKKYAKSLKYEDNNEEFTYYGGTVDFFTMKSVTMISSNIEEFRKQALTIDKYKLYAAPYTLPELDKFLKSIQALKAADFPKSQLYQVRNGLKENRRTASSNYYYFRHRLKKGQSALQSDFENIWCLAKTNGGHIAPWMYDLQEEVYETIWREMVDLFDLIVFSDQESPKPLHKEIAQ